MIFSVLFVIVFLRDVFSLDSSRVSEGVKDLSLYVYTQSDRAGVQLKLSDMNRITKLSTFKTDRETFFYIHGWLEKVDNKGSVLVRDAVLDTSDVNFIILDWDKCANSINYFTSLQCVEEVGNYLGQVLTTLFKTYPYTPDNITLVGHSLGAHIAGCAGTYNKGNLAVIVGLDPASPFVFKDQENRRLCEDDAQFVEAIHTSTLGMNYRVGDVDFWPNGGRFQPGCGLNFLECAHVRAYNYYAESIRANGFVGRKCDSYEDYKNGKCNGNPTGMMGGIDVDKSLRGNFYLTTNDKPPYARGGL